MGPVVNRAFIREHEFQPKITTWTIFSLQYIKLGLCHNYDCKNQNKFTNDFSGYSTACTLSVSPWGVYLYRFSICPQELCSMATFTNHFEKLPCHFTKEIKLKTISICCEENGFVVIQCSNLSWVSEDELRSLTKNVRYQYFHHKYLVGA